MRSPIIESRLFSLWILITIPNETRKKRKKNCINFFMKLYLPLWLVRWRFFPSEGGFYDITWVSEPVGILKEGTHNFNMWTSFGNDSSVIIKIYDDHPITRKLSESSHQVVTNEKLAAWIYVIFKTSLIIAWVMNFLFSFLMTIANDLFIANDYVLSFIFIFFREEQTPAMEFMRLREQ